MQQWLYSGRAALGMVWWYLPIVMAEPSTTVLPTRVFCATMQFCPSSAAKSPTLTEYASYIHLHVARRVRVWPSHDAMTSTPTNYLQRRERGTHSHHLPKDLGPFVAWLLSFILSLSLSHTHIKNHVSSIACGSPTDDHGRDAVTGGRRVRRYVPYIGRCLDQPTAS